MCEEKIDEALSALDALESPDIEKVKKRGAGIREWLKENHPEVYKEQKHLDEGTPERAYWHHGYAQAIKDIAAQGFLCGMPED